MKIIESNFIIQILAKLCKNKESNEKDSMFIDNFIK